MMMGATILHAGLLNLGPRARIGFGEHCATPFEETVLLIPSGTDTDIEEAAQALLGLGRSEGSILSRALAKRAVVGGKHAWKPFGCVVVMDDHRGGIVRIGGRVAPDR